MRKDIKRKYIDWKRTGKNLQLLRKDNMNLRRNVCRALRRGKDNCRGTGDCDNCRFEMDNTISCRELGKVFNVSESVVGNWESGRTAIGLDDILFYCQIAEVALSDIIVYADIL